MSRRSRNNLTISDFYCKVCGGKVPLPRFGGKQREQCHTKDMHCPFCKEQRAFYEVRSIDGHENVQQKMQKQSGVAEINGKKRNKKVSK